MGLINNNRISGHQIIFKGESKGYILLRKELKGKIVTPLESVENDEKSKEFI